MGLQGRTEGGASWSEDGRGMEAMPGGFLTLAALVACEGVLYRLRLRAQRTYAPSVVFTGPKENVS
jgi:hypothetical protein